MKVAQCIAMFALAFGLAHQAQAKSCTIQAYDGHYLTAVGAGGRTTDVIHSDAARASTWEKFNLIDYSFGGPVIRVAIQTANGHFLTAVGGGGRTTDVFHSDATIPQAWEIFTLEQLSNYTFAIKTNSGNYVTAVDSGGRVNDVLHTDATRIGTWEQFRIVCNRR